MMKVDFVHLSNLEGHGDENALSAFVIEILRRGDMTPESQRWLARCFESDRGRRDRSHGEGSQTKFRLKFERRNGMPKPKHKDLDEFLSAKTRHDVFDEACAKFGGPERAIEELVAREKFGGFGWCETTAKKCFEAIKANREIE